MEGAFVVTNEDIDEKSEPRSSCVDSSPSCLLLCLWEAASNASSSRVLATCQCYVKKRSGTKCSLMVPTASKVRVSSKCGVSDTSEDRWGRPFKISAS